MAAKSMAGRNAKRLVTLLALLAVAVAAVVVLLASGGDDDRPRSGGVRDGTGQAGTQLPADELGPDAVRNATPQPGWRPRRGPVPIFRYHAVDQFPAGEAFPELFVEPADFRAQIEWLAAHGYEAVDLRTVERAWFDDGTLPRKPVVLSFDGVEGEFAGVVLPELNRRGWPALIVVDGEGPVERKPLVERLIAAGWEVAAAGTHAVAARRHLERALDTRVVNFCFPPGSFDDANVPVLEFAGYAGATVTGAGFASRAEPYEMPRITVYGLSGADGFAEAMRSRGEGVGA